MASTHSTANYLSFCWYLREVLEILKGVGAYINLGVRVIKEGLITEEVSSTGNKKLSVVVVAEHVGLLGHGSLHNGRHLIVVQSLR